MIRLFVGGTGTSVGKTWLGRGLARLGRRAGLRVAALKPIETGVEHTPEDALALGRAAGRPELAFVPGWVRYRLAASPHAAQLAGEPPLRPGSLVEVVDETAHGSDVLLVEGAGGLFVPLDAETTTADLIAALHLPIVLAAPNRLGVLSDTLATVRAARAMELEIVAVVLTPAPPDPSTPTNAQILGAHLDVPVHTLRACPDDDDALATAVQDAGLEPLLGLGRPTTN